MKSVSYARHELKASDHRPVSALLKLDVAAAPADGFAGMASGYAPSGGFCAALAACLPCCQPPLPPDGYVELR